MTTSKKQAQSPSWGQILGLMHDPKTTTLDVLAVGVPAASTDGEPATEPPAEEAPKKRQITPATPEDVVKMKELGEKAAQAQDEIENIMGPIKAKLKAFQDQLMSPVKGQLTQIEEELDRYSDQLLEKMLSHGTKALKIDGRPPIEVVTKKDKSLTRKELIRILKGEGAKVWNQLTVTEKHSLKIPEATPTEPDGPS